MPYIRVVDNTAVDVTQQNPVECFTSEIASEFQFIDLDIQQGSILINDQWIAPILDLTPIKNSKLSELAAYRYSKETAGITLNGAVIATDLESQAKINGAWAFAQLNPSILIDWKAESGWIQIDATTITAIAGAVASHVQACYTHERVHSTAISALTTVEAVQQYDFTTGWTG